MYNNPYYNFEDFGLSLKKRDEKNELRRLAGFIGLAYLIMAVVGFTWSLVYIAVAIRLGFSYSEAVAVFEEPALMNLIQIILSSVIFTFPFLIIVKNSGLPSKETLAFGKPKGGFFLPTVLIGIGFCAFGNVATNTIGNIFTTFGIDFTPPEIETPKGFFGFIIVIISTAVVPALVEEFAMRGAVLGSLKKYGDGFAILVSSILFALMHGNLVQIPFAFIVGLGIGYAVVKTGSVWTGVVIHFINNFVSILLDTAISSTNSVYLQNAVGLFYYMLCFLCFFLGILAMKKKNGCVLGFERSEMALSTKEKLNTFFSSPLIIICVAATGIECIIYMAM